LAAELTNEACSREAGVFALRELISDESMLREAHRCSVQDLVASVEEEHRAHLATIHVALTAEKNAREAHQHSTIDGHATLEQRIHLVEGTLHDSVEKHGHADATLAQLASDLAALHPDTLHGALVAERDAREAHQNSSAAGRATLELRLAYVEDTLQDLVEKHGQADAIHANLSSALVASQNQSSSDSSLPPTHPDTVLRRLDALQNLTDELAMEASAREGTMQNPLSDGSTALEQRLTYLEGHVQVSIEKHGHADAIHAKLTSAFDALQYQSANESSLPGAHPVSGQQRLDALEMLTDELAREASAREADVYDIRELIYGEARARDTDCRSLQESIASSVATHHATVQQRLDALERKFDDELMKEASTRETDVHELQDSLNDSRAALKQRLRSLCEHLWRIPAIGTAADLWRGRFLELAG